MRACALSVLLGLGLGCTQLVRETDLFHGRSGPLIGTERADLIIPLPRGGALRGRFITSGKGRPVLFHFYGNGQEVSRIDAQLRWMAETFDLDVVCMDYRGYGLSDGRPSLEALREDAVRIYDHLVSRNPGLQVLVSGYSIGSIPAIHLAASRRVDALLLQAPIASAQDVIPAWSKLAPWYSRPFVWVKPSQELMAQRPTPLEEIASVRSPMAILHGDADRIVPIESGRKLFEAASSRRKIWKPLTGITHNTLRLADPEPLQACQSLLWAMREEHR